MPPECVLKLINYTDEKFLHKQEAMLFKIKNLEWVPFFELDKTNQQQSVNLSFTKSGTSTFRFKVTDWPEDKQK